jgi:hypothetical protein
MQKRQRSPDYPGLSLKEAVGRVRSLHEKIGQNPTSRDVVATGMGYRSLSGASAAAVSALKKYGLLEGRGEEIRVSSRALAILYAHSQDERSQALREAANEPELFRELSERFLGSNLTDDLLRNYLLRNGYSAQAATSVISAYRDTMEFVRGESGGYDSGISPNLEARPMPQLQTPSANPTRGAPPLSVAPPSGSGAERDDVKIGELGFAGVGFVKIFASPDLDTRKALRMAKQVIAMMETALAEEEDTFSGEEEEEEEGRNEHDA